MTRVMLTFDGERIPAEEGEPIATALVRAGRLTVARSPKFHRPRGPTCFRGACDGCLARVDGQPNVMTCLEPVHDGCVIESQNTLGARELYRPALDQAYNCEKPVGDVLSQIKPQVENALKG